MYMFMTLGAFSVAIFFERYYSVHTVEDLSGYGWHGTLTNSGHGDASDGTTGNSSTIAGINARFPNATPAWIESPKL